MTARAGWISLSLSSVVAAALLTGVAAASEPSIAELQRAAVSVAHLDADQVERWRHRMRLSPLAPTLRVRVGRGTTAVASTTDYNGNTKIVVGDNNAWQFDIAASWSFDRLAWHPDEMRVAREAQRIASRRERLVMEVAALAAERTRLMRGLVAAPPRTAMERVEATLRIEEITAVLDGLTGGALSAAAAPSHGAARDEDAGDWPQDPPRVPGDSPEDGAEPR